MYKTIWFKIHWILGVVFGLTLIIIGITGAALSYEKEIISTINKDSYFVSAKSGQEKLSTKEILKKYIEINPTAKINSISFSNDDKSSTVLNIASDNPKDRRGQNIYINPYTAEVLPQVQGSEFFSFMMRLHRWMAFEGDMQKVGKHVVALSTIACIILTLSGLIIYWPRIKNSFLNSITFSFKSKKRAFLSSIHSVVGLWVIPFFLLMTLTGLYWSYDWYRSAMFTVFQVEQPIRNAPVKPKEEANKNHIIQNEKDFNDYQKAVEMFNVFVQKDYANAVLRIPQKGSVYTISYLDINSPHYRARNSIELDIDSWKLLKHEKYSDKPLNEKIMSSILPLHSGEYFGWIGQFIMFISSALMALFVITGFMLYFDRLKKKKARLNKN